MKCLECNYCVCMHMRGNTRNEYFCKHPNQYYIHDYFAKHRLIKMPAFLGFGKNRCPIKTSPRWCPYNAEQISKKGVKKNETVN